MIFITYTYYSCLFFVYTCVLIPEKIDSSFMSLVVAVLLKSNNRIKLWVKLSLCVGSGLTASTTVWLCHRFHDERFTCNNVESNNIMFYIACAKNTQYNIQTASDKRTYA